MSVYMNLQTSDREALIQLESEHSLTIDEIESVREEVKSKFKKFYVELERREEEILNEINRVKGKITDSFIQQKSNIFDTTQSYESDDLSTRINIIWRKSTLEISDICEIQTVQRRKSHSFLSPNSPYGDLTKILNKSRHSQTSLNPIDIKFPFEMHLTAKQLIKNKQHKYRLLPIYDIIQHNLKRGKSIEDLHDGIFSLSKYAICLFVGPNRAIFHTIQTQSEYYRQLVSSKIEDYEVILYTMDFNFNQSTKLFNVNLNSLSSAQYIRKLGAICCELLLASEELLYFKEISKEKYIDSIAYFSPKLLEFIDNPSICPITDAVDFCASSRDASFPTTQSSSLDNTYSSATISVSSQYYTPTGRNYENDTPNSSLSDTQYHSRISNCSDEAFQSRNSESNSDIHESVKPVINEKNFISRAFQYGASEEFFSLNERINDRKEDFTSTYHEGTSVASVGANDYHYPRLSQHVNLAASVTPVRVTICPQCKREVDSRYQVCPSCRLYLL